MLNESLKNVLTRDVTEQSRAAEAAKPSRSAERGATEFTDEVKRIIRADERRAAESDRAAAELKKPSRPNGSPKAAAKKASGAENRAATDRNQNVNTVSNKETRKHIVVSESAANGKSDTVKKYAVDKLAVSESAKEFKFNEPSGAYTARYLLADGNLAAIPATPALPSIEGAALEVRNSQASELISAALAKVSAMLSLPSSVSFDEQSLIRFDQESLEQFAEILQALESIGNLLDEVAVSGKDLDAGGVSISADDAAMLSADLRVEKFHIQMGLSMIGAREIVSDIMAEKSNTPLPASGISQAADPASLGMSTIDTARVYGSLTEESLAAAIERIKLAKNGQAENAGAQNTKVELTAADSQEMRAMFKAAAGNVKTENVTAENVKVGNVKVENVKVDNAAAQTVKAENVNINNVKIDNVKAENVNVNNVKVEDVKVDNAAPKTVKAENVNIGNVKIDNVKAENFNVNNVKVEDVKVDNAAPQTVKAENANINNVKIDNVKTENVSVDNIKVDNTTPQTVKPENVKIDNVKIDDVKVDNTTPQSVKSEGVKIDNVKVEDVKVDNTPSQSVKSENVKIDNVKVEDVKVDNTTPQTVKSEKVNIDDVKTEEVKVDNTPPQNVNKVDNAAPQSVKAENIIVNNVKPENVEVDNTASQTVKSENVKIDDVKADDIKVDNAKVEQAKAENIKTQDVKTENVKTERVEADKAEDVKPEHVKIKPDNATSESVKADVAKSEHVAVENAKSESGKPKNDKPESVKAKEVKSENVKPETAKAFNNTEIPLSVSELANAKTREAKTAQADAKYAAGLAGVSIANEEAAVSAKSDKSAFALSGALPQNPMAVSESEGVEPQADIVQTDIAQAKAQAAVDSVQKAGTAFSRVDNEEIIRQITDKMHHAIRNGAQEVRMVLRPEALGEVRMSLRVEGDVVFARIQVENSQVKAIVESQLQNLKDSLEQQNLQAGAFSVDVGSDKERSPREAWQELAEAARLNKFREGDVERVGAQEADAVGAAAGSDTGRRFGNNTFELFI